MVNIRRNRIAPKGRHCIAQGGNPGYIDCRQTTKHFNAESVTLYYSVSVFADVLHPQPLNISIFRCGKNNSPAILLEYESVAGEQPFSIPL